MKLNKIQALVLTLGVALSSGAMFAGKAGAAPAATSTATFTGTVAPSCTVTTPFAASTGYLIAGLIGPSGGPTEIEATSDAVFNCNSDTLSITAVGTPVPPTAPTNATSIEGTHAFTYELDNALISLPQTAAASDTSGNASITVRSTWTGGEDLLSGTYGATSVVTVTAN